MAAVVQFGRTFELSQNESEPELTLAMCSCHVVKIFHSTETICARFNFGRSLGLPEETCEDMMKHTNVRSQMNG